MKIPIYGKLFVKFHSASEIVRIMRSRIIEGPV